MPVVARQERSASGSCRSTSGPDGAVLVVFGDPSIKVGLQLVDRAVDLFAERHPVKLIQHGAMKALADAIGLRAFGLGAAVIDVLDGEIELVFVALSAAKLGAAIGQQRDRRMPCSS